ERDLDAVVAAARVEAMGRRIRVAEARGAVHLHPEARRRRRAGPRAGTVSEAPCISHAIEQLRVTERDLAGLAWRNREYARPQQAVTGQLDQGRVAFAAHDVLVNRARLARIHRLALQLAVALPQREIAEHGLARQRI